MRTEPFGETTAPLQRHVIHGPTMGTRYSAVFYAEASVDNVNLRRELQAAVDAVDDQMSTWKPDSDLMRFNRAPAGKWFDVPDQLYSVLSEALEIGRLSDGAFDIGVGDLVSAWGFGSNRPGPDNLEEAVALRQKPRVPAHLCLELDRGHSRVRKQADIVLDLSGIAKGFGVDELGRVLAAAGIKHALVSIDGEVRSSGGKPDGSPWRVAVETPQTGRRAAEGVLELSDCAVATSGDYRHFIEIGGDRYPHTMDPRRGAPLTDGPASVTVLARTCMAADAWATALLVLGPTAGDALASRHGLEALFIERPQNRPPDKDGPPTR